MDEPTPRDRAAVIDDAFGGLQRWGIRLIVFAASVFVLGWIVGQLWVVIFPVALALIVSTVLEPPTSWLRDRRVPSDPGDRTRTSKFGRNRCAAAGSPIFPLRATSRILRGESGGRVECRHVVSR